MLNINGVDLNLNMLDYDVAVRYELAMDNLQEVKESNTERFSQIIKEQCEIVFRFFDDLFGAGTADKVFKGKYDFQACTIAINDVVCYWKSQGKEYNKLLNKYAPNRHAAR